MDTYLFDQHKMPQASKVFLESLDIPAIKITYNQIKTELWKVVPIISQDAIRTSIYSENKINIESRKISVISVLSRREVKTLVFKPVFHLKKKKHT